LTAGVVDRWQITAGFVDIDGKFTASVTVACANM
jgi:hypothetical protein